MSTPHVTLIDIRAAADLLGYKNPRTLYVLIKTEGFPSPICVGPRRSDGRAGKSRFVLEEIQAWLAVRVAEQRTAQHA
ncbi:hypothetical protein RBI94_08595 [Pseudomonas putida]|uniref:helix-turn-helix transcriptional regulator n=1 Tax=Pseudomonas putida TaxID=303 RepID=UPI0007716E44|nr:hypothetical protein [Pseudomonas putida]KWW13226.1 hypothetical protein AS889_16260 [Pseudomonas putida]MDQ2484069.1 hypothetical protein [Pseudomonas putida]